MKNLLFTLTFLAVVFSCEEREVNEDIASSNNQDILEELYETDFEYLENYSMPEEDIEMLQQIGFGGSDAFVIQQTKPDGKKSISYLLERDIEVEKDSLPNMAEAYNSLNGRTMKNEQYRTNFIASPRHIRIAAYDLYYTSIPRIANLRTGIERAVANYNALGLNITFEVRFAPSPSGAANLKRFNLSYGNSAHIKIRIVDFGGRTLGQAGFPYSTGGPYRSVRLDDDLGNRNVDVCEHIVTHVLGHCIGLRHTDWFDRTNSCGVERDQYGNVLNPNEGSAGVGAIHIPGTPARSNDANSIMKACINGNENGEFTSYDRVALRALF